MSVQAELEKILEKYCVVPKVRVELTRVAPLVFESSASRLKWLIVDLWPSLIEYMKATSQESWSN